MKSCMSKIVPSTLALSFVLVMSAPVVVTSCQENISEDAYAIASKQTISEYLADNDELSMIKAVLDEVKLGHSEQASALSSVLSARGNYTVFAPTNAAVTEYVRELLGDSQMSVDVTTLGQLTDAQKERIALNCIIDNNDDAAYELSDFPSNGAFAISNLNDRRVTCVQDANNDYVLNNQAKVVQSNIEASNGMVHIIDHVIVPSDNTVAELVQKAGNMRIMGRLLAETGWADSLTLKTEEEEQYEIDYQAQAGDVKANYGANNQTHDVPFMSKRAVGYTAFVETDEVFNIDWGIPLPIYDESTETITNWDEIQVALLAKCQEVYGTAAPDDLTDANNAINRFVGYHLLDGKMAMEDRDCVHHFNEYKYQVGDVVNPRTNYTVNVWDYYTTKCRYEGDQAIGRSLLKITQVATGEHDFYLNRISQYDNAFKGEYTELSWTENNVSNGLNVKVSKTNGDYDNNASNGFYFPIDHVLVNSEETQNALGSERLRIDVVTMLPEILSNGLRGKEIAYFPSGYFKNITNESSSTEIAYLQDLTGQGAWRDYQGDELLIMGQYDLVLKLPPVPKTGNYELRLGVSNNRLRSMMQVYIGESPDGTVPIGLPIDQRENNSDIPGNPWVADGEQDELVCRENDRNLRNQGYMKGPNYICSTGKPDETVRNIDTGSNRDSGPALRRILTSRTFEKDKTYYLRFKSALSESRVEFYLDYIEFVPSNIYNDDSNPEDIW